EGGNPDGRAILRQHNVPQVNMARRILALVLLAGVAACKTASDSTKEATAATASSSIATKAAPAASNGADACEPICRHPRALRCPNPSQCLTACREMQASSVCRAQIHSFLDCLLKQPTEHWECDEDGIGSIQDGYCDAEQAAVATCVQAAAK